MEATGIGKESTDETMHTVLDMDVVVVRGAVLHDFTSVQIHSTKKRNPFSFQGISSAGASLVTLIAHFMMSAVSSDTTRSTHLRLGSLSLRICFFTIASNARSGVKSPVLNGHGPDWIWFWKNVERNRQRLGKEKWRTGRKETEEIETEKKSLFS